jgi:hypothetical protein
VGLNLSETHQLLVYADNVNLLGDNMDTVAYLLHARTVEPQKQTFLSNTRTQQWNNRVMQTVSRQHLGKHISA